MKTITIDGHSYKIIFQYKSKFGKRPRLGRKAPYQAIVTCTILEPPTDFFAQEDAVCSEHVAPQPTPAMREVLRLFKLSLTDPKAPWWYLGGQAVARAEAEMHPDQYSRREGRLRSLAKTLDRCGRLRKIKMEFLEAYLALDPKPLAPERLVLSDQRKEELIAQGQEGKGEKRLQRKQNKNKKASLAASSPAAPESRECGSGGNG